MLRGENVRESGALVWSTSSHTKVGQTDCTEAGNTTLRGGKVSRGSIKLSKSGTRREVYQKSLAITTTGNPCLGP